MQTKWIAWDLNITFKHEQNLTEKALRVPGGRGTPGKYIREYPSPPSPQRGENRELKQRPFWSDARQAEVDFLGSGLFFLSILGTNRLYQSEETLPIPIWQRQGILKGKGLTSTSLSSLTRITPHPKTCDRFCSALFSIRGAGQKDRSPRDENSGKLRHGLKG